MTERRRVLRQHLEGRVAPTFSRIPTQTPPDSLPAQRYTSTTKTRTTFDKPDPTPSRKFQGLYIISVAARLLEMHPQTLRKYERIGLVRPSRTLGMLRLYSEQDIIRLRFIKHLVDDLRINLAGVEFALGVLSRILEIRQRLESLKFEDGVREALEIHLSTMMDLLDVDESYTHQQAPFDGRVD